MIIFKKNITKSQIPVLRRRVSAIFSFNGFALMRSGLALILFFFVGSSTYAYPPLPSSFYGTVKVNGTNVPDGTLIQPYILGIPYNNTKTFTYNGESWYFFDLLGDDFETLAREGGREGEAITWKIDGKDANERSVWKGGLVQYINLTISNIPTSTHTPSPPQDPPVISFVAIDTFSCQQLTMKIRIRGTNFYGTPTLIWKNENNNLLEHFDIISSTQTTITVELKNLDQAKPGHYSVTVINPDGRRSISTDTIAIPGPLTNCPGINVSTSTSTPFFTNTPIAFISKTPIYGTPTPIVTIQPTRTPPLAENDRDNDGMDDTWEKENGLDPTNPNDSNNDNDGDGITNLKEYQNRSNPKNKDSDADGLSDYDEINTHKTDANNPDTDGDGLSDYEEVIIYHTNPLNPDSDYGGIDDYTEVKIRKTDPLDPNTALLRGVVFDDKNKNGIRDTGETGIGDIVIALKDSPRTTTSQRDGTYIFERVQPGTYKLTLEQSLLNKLQISFTPILIHSIKEEDIISIDIPLAPSLFIDLLPKTGSDFTQMLLYLIFLMLVLLIFQYFFHKQKIHLILKKKISSKEKKEKENKNE